MVLYDILLKGCTNTAGQDDRGKSLRKNTLKRKMDEHSKQVNDDDNNDGGGRV